MFICAGYSFVVTSRQDLQYVVINLDNGILGKPSCCRSQWWFIDTTVSLQVSLEGTRDILLAQLTYSFGVQCRCLKVKYSDIWDVVYFNFGYNFPMVFGVLDLPYCMDFPYTIWIFQRYLAVYCFYADILMEKSW